MLGQAKRAKSKVKGLKRAISSVEASEASAQHFPTLLADAEACVMEALSRTTDPTAAAAVRLTESADTTQNMRSM